MNTKVCITCEIEKPISKFRRHKLKNGSFSFSSKCYVCCSNRDRRNKKKAYTINLPFEKDGELVKICSKCKTEKPLTEFNKHSRTSFGHTSACKPCVSSVYYTKRPKPRLKFSDPQRCLKCKINKPLSKYQKRIHRDSTVGYNRTCIACCARKYSKKRWKKTKSLLNKIPKSQNKYSNLHIAYVVRRRASKYNPPFLMLVVKDDIIKRDGLMCYLCDKKLAENEVVLEHLIPLSRGGSHKPENIKVSCAKCNNQKHNKTVTEFKKWRGDYDRFNLSTFETP